DAIPFLVPKLTDTFLVHTSAQALATIGTKQAKEVLREAMTKASLKTLPAIIQALGYAEDARAKEIIDPYAQSKNFKIRKAALYALASIGDPSSAPTLIKAAQKAKFEYTAVNSVGDCML